MQRDTWSPRLAQPRHPGLTTQVTATTTWLPPTPGALSHPGLKMMSLVTLFGGLKSLFKVGYDMVMVHTFTRPVSRSANTALITSYSASTTRWPQFCWDQLTAAWSEFSWPRGCSWRAASWSPPSSWSPTPSPAMSRLGASRHLLRAPSCITPGPRHV